MKLNIFLLSLFYVIFQAVLYFIGLMAGFKSDAPMEKLESLIAVYIFITSIYLFIPTVIISLIIDIKRKKLKYFIILPNLIFIINLIWAIYFK